MVHRSESSQKNANEAVSRRFMGINIIYYHITKARETYYKAGRSKAIKLVQKVTNLKPHIVLFTVCIWPPCPVNQDIYEIKKEMPQTTFFIALPLFSPQFICKGHAG